MKKAQTSLEFLSVFAIGLALIVIMSGVFFTFSEGAKDNLDNQQVNRIGEDIISNAEQVYFYGNGNRLSINAKFPQSIANFTIHHYNETPDDSNDYDILNISLYVDGGQKRDLIFYPKEDYIRINCTDCFMTQLDDNYSVSYYNGTYLRGGNKQFRIESKGDWVSIDFVLE